VRDLTAEHVADDVANRPARNGDTPPARLPHDGALVRSRSTPGSPHRVRPRRQPLRDPMNGLELVVAFLAGVLMGGALDFFVLPLLVDAWIDRRRRHQR
jgi:hypothetical protein